MVELNTQDMLLSGDSQQLRRREQKCVSLGENCLSSLGGEEEKASKNEHPKFGAFWLEDVSNMWCEYSMQAVCKISRCGKKEGEGRKKEGERKKKEEERRKNGGQKKEEWRTEEGRGKDGSAGNGSEPYWSWWTKLGLEPSSVSVLISDSRASVPGTPADQRDSPQA